MSDDTGALSAYFLTGILYILVSIPLLFGRIGPNRFYRFRIARAYESTEMWYKVNRIGAKVFVGYGVTMLAIGTIVWFVSLPVSVTVEPLLIGNVLLVFVSLVHVRIACNSVG
jgi:hypothetical protein